MAYQQQQQPPPPVPGPGSGSSSGSGLQFLNSPFGDTTFTKVFVGGLAWETQSDTMRRYFEQFGEILEAVVITDKNTGRSKGYGFVSASLFFFHSFSFVLFSSKHIQEKCPSFCKLCLHLLADPNITSPRLPQERIYECFPDSLQRNDFFFGRNLFF